MDTCCIYTVNSHLQPKATVKVLSVPTQETPSHNDCHDFLSSKYKNTNSDHIIQLRFLISEI